MRGSAGAGGDPAADWSASFIAWWSLDEASGTRIANGSTSCGSAGSDCDLADNATVTNDTTNKQEGTASASFASTNSEYLDCADGTCNELDMTGSGESFTWGCWWRSGSDVSQMLLDNYDEVGGSKGGYNMERLTVSDRGLCEVRDQNSIYNLLTAIDSMPADDGWVHVACQVTDNGTGSFSTFIDGELSTNLPAVTPETAPDGEDFFLGTQDAATIFMDGELDECFVIDDLLTEAEVCRVCSCQVDGSLCTCNGTSYDDDGRNSTECGSCTLPDCDAAAP
jgi:hypothetical protein